MDTSSIFGTMTAYLLADVVMSHFFGLSMSELANISPLLPGELLSLLRSSSFSEITGRDMALMESQLLFRYTKLYKLLDSLSMLSFESTSTNSCQYTKDKVPLSFL